MSEWKQKRWFRGLRADLRRGWLVSYLVIFCVPLAAYLLMSSVTLRIIREQTYDLNGQALDIAALATDHQKQSVEMSVAELLVNEKLSTLLRVQTDGSPDTKYKTRQFQQLLEGIVGRNPMIQSIYLYMNEGNYIVSDKTKTKPAYFYESECSDLQMEREDWMYVLQQRHSKEYVSWENKNGETVLMLLVDIASGGEYIRNGATLCVKIDSAKFWQVVSEKDDMLIEVYDSGGQSLFTGLGQATNNPVILKSQTTGWRYKAYIEDTVVAAQERYIIFLIIGGILLAVIVGGILTWHFIRRNYNPIRSMVSRLESVFEQKGRDTQEIPYIENSMNQLIRQMQQDRKEIQERQELMNRAYLICLLLGQYPGDISIRELLEMEGFDLSTRFCVAVLAPDHKLTDQTAGRLLGLGESETSLFYSKSVELDGKIIFIIDEESGNEDSFQHLNERFVEYFPNSKMAWSSGFTGAEQIVYGYEEAQYILSSSPSNSFAIYTLKYIQEQDKREIIIPEELNQQLSYAIQSGNQESATDLVNHIWQINNLYEEMPLNSAKILALALYNRILEARRLIRGDSERLDMQTLHNIQIRAKSTAQVYTSLQSALLDIIKDLSYVNHSHDEQVVIKMKSYIDMHYADVLLNVDSLCRAFERAQSGVTKAFREITGHGPLYYINYRRVQEAKRLFTESEGELTASQVMKKVGYTNLNTFTRAFKKNEGITPGQFKETILQVYISKKE